MIGATGATRVFVATLSIDFRKGVDGLAALVRDMVGGDPFDGAIYVFWSWPKIENGVMRLSATQLSAFDLLPNFPPVIS